MLLSFTFIKPSLFIIFNENFYVAPHPLSLQKSFSTAWTPTVNHHKYFGSAVFTCIILSSTYHRLFSHPLSQNCPLPTLKGIATEFMQNEELAAAIEKSLSLPRAGQVWFGEVISYVYKYNNMPHKFILTKIFHLIKKWTAQLFINSYINNLLMSVIERRFYM